MKEHTLRVLEFGSILNLLKGYASSDLGKSLCESLKPVGDIKQIEDLLNEVSELKEVLQVHGDIPIGGIKDIEESIIKTRVEGSILDPFEFLDILSTLEVTHQLKRFFDRLKGNTYPLLKELGSRFIPTPDLEYKIKRTIGERGDVLDSASLKLKEIRRKIRLLRTKIQTSLENLLDQGSFQSFFQEKIITIRNGRYVIPVKSDFKGHIQGIIHDHSHSKATYFIEPISTIEMNNELSLLSKEEKSEEIRVLKSLSNDIKANAPEIVNNLRILEKVDVTYAKAKYSIELNGEKPILNKEGRANLINAYHPLLLSLQNGDKDVVPIDIHFDKGCNALIITGANTGGKTVALKTIGILTLMVQTGMHIPVADGSVAAVFASIFADIGDEQDIEQNLSTFSSHISQIVEILDEADESSLVLLDEIGVGTDPDEGAALAMAFLDYLKVKRSSVIATTHLNLLKAYAYLHEDVINISVEFDTETMKPLYRLIYGVSGESKALVIAERLGIPQEILNKAVSFMENKNGHISSLIKALENSQREIIEERKELRELREITLACQEKMGSLVKKIQEKKDVILLEAETRAREFIKKTENKAREILKDIENKRKHRFCGINERLHNLKEELEIFKPVTSRKRDRLPPLNIRMGDVVKISPLNKEGIIVKTREGSDQVEVLIGNLKVKVRINDLEEASASEKEFSDRIREDRLIDAEIKGEKPINSPTTVITDKINVVGRRVDDALPLLDKAIDNAIVSGKTKVHVIHGIGPGRLREAIRDHLKDHTYVTDFSSADLSQGGAGVTVVEIKV